jgi:excisionase family DNA binding protein
MNISIHIETFSLDEAAAFLGMNAEVVRRRAASGEIPGAKTGKGWRFLNIDLVDFLRSQYPVKRQEPQSAIEKEKTQCHSSNAVTHGTSISSHRTENEYDKVLGL